MPQLQFTPPPAPRRALSFLLALATGLTLAAGPMWAADLDRAQAQWLQGQREQALQSVQEALKLKPEDARLRFAQAVMQAGLGRLAEAEAGLLALTQDYPDLADPYNNLAVIYAGRGELERARQALEQALRLQPEHVLAAENLGDVLLRLALRAYERAASQGSGERQVLELKLSGLRELLARQSGSAARAASAASAAE